jgi:adenylate cyclase
VTDNVEIDMHFATSFMKRLKRLLLILISVCTTNLSAQQAKLDSLIKLYNSHVKEDNRKLEILNKLTFVYYNMQLDSAEKYADRSITLAGKLINSSALAEALYNKAILMNLKGNYRKAIDLSEQSLAAAQKVNDSKAIANAYLCKSAPLFFIGKTDSSLLYAEKSYEIFKASNDSLGLGISLLTKCIPYFFNDFEKCRLNFLQATLIFDKLNEEEYSSNAQISLASLFMNASQYDSCSYYLKKVEKQINDSKHYFNLSQFHNYSAFMYFGKAEYHKAIEHFLLELRYHELLGNKMYEAYCLNNLAMICREINSLEKGLYYLRKQMPISIALNDKYSISGAYQEYSYIYLKQNKLSLALENVKKMYDAVKDLNRNDRMADTYSLFGEVYEKMAQYDSALHYYSKAIELCKNGYAPYLMSRNLIGTARTLKNIPDVLIKDEMKTIANRTERIKQAIDYAMQGFTLAKENHEMGLQCDAALVLSELYEMQNNAAKALIYNKMYTSLHDSVLGIEKTKAIEEQQFKYETEKKDAFLKAEQEKKDEKARDEVKKQRIIRNSIGGGLAIVLLFSIVVYRQRNKISIAKKVSEDLLLNILPSETAEELKEKGSADAKQFDEVTVMFTDFKNFTQASEMLSATELVKEIHKCYSEFDKIISKHNLEKIKTIGDSYMCAGGLPIPNKTNAEDATKAALEICDFMEQEKLKRISEEKTYFEIRIGLHTGPVVAGIVGIKKFAYDIWGDTVNIASRMESSGEAGKVNISGSTYELVKDKFTFTNRGKIQAKHKGEIDMYFVEAVS